MADKKFKPAVSLQAAVNYVVKERDHYKEKLEILIPYTKNLEARMKDMAKEHNDEVGKIQARLDRKIKEYDDLYKELVALRRDYKESGWYRDLTESNKRLREKITSLNAANNRLIAENFNLKKHGNE